jgi:hypothetical protein
LIDGEGFSFYNIELSCLSLSFSGTYSIVIYFCSSCYKRLAACASATSFASLPAFSYATLASSTNLAVVSSSVFRATSSAAFFSAIAASASSYFILATSAASSASFCSYAYFAAASSASAFS